MGDIEEVDVQGIDKIVESAYRLEKEYYKNNVWQIPIDLVWIALCIAWMIKRFGPGNAMFWAWGVLLLVWVGLLIFHTVKAVKSKKIIKKYKEYFRKQQGLLE